MEAKMWKSAAVKIMYTDNIVVLKIEKEVREILQEVGV
jgi:hypothetical protein